jgi:hypothetical protein
LPLQARLLKDTIERANWHVDAEFAGHRHSTRFNRVLKLTVTATRSDVPPPVTLEELDHFANLHVKVLPSKAA